MSYAQIPDFSVSLVPTTVVERVPFHADPVLAAIDAHDEAWSVWQAAPEARVAGALAEMIAALDRLLVTPCATRFGSLTLLRHLRWHIQHDGITDAAVLARANDLARSLHLDFLPVTPAIRPRVPAPSIPAILRLRLNLWRLRRISAGLERAKARGDEAGFSRWLARGLKACDDLEASRLSCKAPYRVR